jgi:hypothetical protein
MTVPMVYPGSPNARRTDPLTSHEAADSVDEAASCAEVRRLLGKHGPLTDEQIAWKHAAPLPRPLFSPSRLRTARHELEESGVVVDVGEGRTRSGRRCRLWALKTE